MAFLIFDRVQETSTSTGTGPFSLAGAKTGFRTFASVLTTGDTTYYTITQSDVGAWEVGLGTYSGVNTLTRTTVLASSNANAAVNFGAGSKDVFITAAAAMLPPEPVRSFNGRTGNITPQQADYDAFFTTPAEAAAAAPVQSVNGQTGNVIVAAGTNNTAVTRSAPTASASTALTTIQSYPVAAGEITAGSVYSFTASLRVINTTTATNLVVTASVGATNVLVLTQALGTTAAAAPGSGITITGEISFYSATQAHAFIIAHKPTAVGFTASSNTATAVTVSAAGATTIDLKINTSGTTSTFTCLQATILRVK